MPASSSASNAWVADSDDPQYAITGRDRAPSAS
jgi:hypothetical protein